MDLALAREHGPGIQALVEPAPAASDVADAVPLTMSAPEARRDARFAQCAAQSPAQLGAGQRSFAQSVLSLAGGETAPHAVWLLNHECMVAALAEHRALLAVLLGPHFPVLPDGTALGVGGKEDLWVDAAADPVVLPFPVFHDGSRQTGQVSRESLPPR